MKRGAQPTWTALTLEYLRQRDDFARLPEIAAATGGTVNQIGAALWHLRARRCVDVIVQPDGVGWWSAMPPESDNRSRHLDERVLETKPRKRRKGATHDPKHTP